MNRQDARAEGEAAGYSAGLYGTEGAQDEETFYEMAYESEMNARQYSPFEFTAREINDSKDPDAVWDAYDAGVSKGIGQAWKERTEAGS